MSQLREKVRMLESMKDTAIQAGVLKATEGMGEKLLARYREGLHDGASLTSGKGMATNTPASAVYGRD